MSNFEIGDIVYLKSGGPDMTVNGFEKFSNSLVEVVWFTDNKIHKEFLPEEVLLFYDDEFEKEAMEECYLQDLYEEDNIEDYSDIYESNMDDFRYADLDGEDAYVAYINTH